MSNEAEGMADLHWMFDMLQSYRCRACGLGFEISGAAME